MPVNQAPKFPDMRPSTTRGAAMINLPTPAGYRQSVPVFPTSDSGIKTRGERKRYLLWFAAAVALHGALFVGWWLTPPLRLKWEPPPESWVRVTSLAKEVPQAPILDAVKVAKPVPKRRNHKTRPVGEPDHAKTER